jgi:hypothetical protein
MKQFELVADQFGNLLINKGFVIDLSDSTTAFYELGATEESVLQNNDNNGTRIIDTDRLFFLGGSGTSLEFTGTLTDSAPLGYYSQEDEFDWAKRNFTIVGTPATGAEMSDGTNIVADIVGAFTVAPTGTWNSTTYGKDTYNGGTVFTLTAAIEDTGGGGVYAPAFIHAVFEEFTTEGTFPNIGSATDGEYEFVAPYYVLVYNTGMWELREITGGTLLDSGGSDPSDPSGVYNDGTYDITVTVETNRSTITTTATSGAVQVGNFVETDWLTWTSEDDSDFTVTVNNDGTADLSDATDIIASRATELIRQPQGIYQSTSYGADTYNNGAAFLFTIGNAPAMPQYSFVWVEIELLAGAFVAATGPFIGASLPANSATLEVYPIGFSNGSGVVKQIHEGPIIWRG